MGSRSALGLAALAAACTFIAPVCQGQPIIKTIAGGGPSLIPPQGVSALSIGMGYVSGLATDTSGNLFVSGDNMVYRITPAGMATAVAGTGATGFSDGGGVALNATFGGAGPIAVDNGFLYIADPANGCVWQVNLASGAIVLFAGTPNQAKGIGAGGSNGDGGPAVQAGLGYLAAIAADHQGSLYVLGDGVVRKIAIASGIIASVPMLGPAAAAVLEHTPYYMALDPTGSILYLGSGIGPVLAITMCTGAVNQINLPYSQQMAVDPQGNLYITSYNGIMVVPGGNGTPAPVPTASNDVTSVAVDSNGNLYYAYDQTYSFVEKSTVTGASQVLFAGNGTNNFNGDGNALQITMSTVGGLAADPAGIVYFSDTGNNRVRKVVLSTGVVSTVAQVSAGWLALDVPNQILYMVSGTAILSVDVGSGTLNTILNSANAPSGFSPGCLALDGLGNLYISSSANTSSADYNIIYKYAIQGGSLTTVFNETFTSGGFIGLIGSLAADSSGNVYSAYQGGCYIYQLSNGQTTTLAAMPSCKGVFGPVILLALDGHGNLLTASNDVVQSIQLGTQAITTLTSAATHTYYSGEGGPLACAQLDDLTAFATDGAGNFFVADFSGRIVEGVNWASTPSSTVPVSIGSYPANDGLAVSIDGSAFSTSQNQNWSLATAHNLSAAASQTGQDGYAYSFTGWNDGNPSASRAASASCPATFSALYSPPACTYWLGSAGGAVYDFSRDLGFFLGSSGAACSWVAESNASWIHLQTPAAGSGSGYLSVLVDANSTGASRMGTVSVANQTYTVTQLAPSGCAYQLSAPEPGGLLGPGVTTGAVYVTTVGDGCGSGAFATWQAIAQASWLHVTSGASGGFGGEVVYSADADSSSGSRMGTILIAGQTYTVTQEGTGTTLAFSPTAAQTAASGGLEMLMVYDLDGSCDTWTSVSNQPWVTVVLGASGSGSGLVAYSVDANLGAPRSGSLTIGGNTYTINQAGGGSCAFSLPSQSAGAPTGGGTGMFNLTASGPFCSWSAVSSASWLTVTSPQVGQGSATLSYATAANAGGPRSATITTGGQTFTVNQAPGGFAVTFSTVPAGLQVMVDGSPITGSTATLEGMHTLSVESPQAGPSGTQYVFASWSDDGAQSHSIDVTGTASYTATFTTQYQLTTAAVPTAGGTVAPASGSYYNSGAAVALMAVASAGYQFTGWTGPVANTANASTTVTMAGPETVTATFAVPTPITIETSPTGLQFTVDGGAPETAPATVNLAPGPHTLAVQPTQAGGVPVPGTQYVFASWSDTGTASHTITVTSSAATYTATFTTQYQLTISALPAAGGTVTPASGGFYSSGTNVTIAATANSGYQFSGWSGTVANSSNPSTTVTISAPETVTASFAALTAITIQTSPPGLQFTLNGGGAQTAPQTLNLTPGTYTIAVAGTQPGPAGTPAGTQYVFTSWSDGNPTNPRTIAVGSSPATYTIDFQTQYQLTTSASPVAGGMVTPATGGFYNAGTSVPVTATANSGFQFSNWTGSVAGSTNASTTVTMNGPETVVASFSSLTGITIQTSPPGLQFSVNGGAAQTAPQTLNLTPGSYTIAVATTQAGAPAGTQYVFLAWSDGGAASHSIVVGASAATYTATFTQQYLLTTAVSPAGAGSVTATPSSSGYYNAGTSVELTASPNAGYAFSGWSGDLSGSTNPQSITMNAPHTVTAGFAIPSCSIALTPVSTSLPGTGTSTVEVCPNNSGQPTCGVYPETPQSFTVTPNAACGTWTATSSSAGFLQVLSGAGPGSGPGTVTFAQLTNTHNGQQSNTITVTSGAASATYTVTEAGNPDSQTYREIYALYEQLLGRDPDSGGLAFWTGVGGSGLGQMADDFLTSPEFFNSGFAVMAAYQAATGAPPNYAQYTAAVANIRAGAQTVPGLFTTLTGAGFPSTALYQNLLNRSPGAADSNCIATGLAQCFQAIIGYPANTTPVSAANNEFQSTGTYHTTLAADHTNALYMTMVYFVTLNRDPDPSGYAFWLGIAKTGGPGLLFQGAAGYFYRDQILGPGTPNQGFIGSPEFQGLFAN